MGSGISERSLVGHSRAVCAEDGSIASVFGATSTSLQELHHANYLQQYSTAITDVFRL